MIETQLEGRVFLESAAINCMVRLDQRDDPDSFLQSDHNETDLGGDHDRS
jgi:hypothetical protein